MVVFTRLAFEIPCGFFKSSVRLFEISSSFSSLSKRPKLATPVKKENGSNK